MIPLREIAAWRAHAPCPNDMQVEQDLLLTRAMGAIFVDEFLRSQVAMRGGTALHKVHLAPAARYSEDIDLVLVGDRPGDHVEKALKRVLNPILGAPRTNMWAKVVLAVRNWRMPSEILRLEWFYRPTFSAQEEAKLKVEVNCTERTPFYDVVELPCDPVPPGSPKEIALRSYDIDEMLGTKMRTQEPLRQRLRPPRCHSALGPSPATCARLKRAASRPWRCGNPCCERKSTWRYAAGDRFLAPAALRRKIDPWWPFVKVASGGRGCSRC